MDIKPPPALTPPAATARPDIEDARPAAENAVFSVPDTGPSTGSMSVVAELISSVAPVPYTSTGDVAPASLDTEIDQLKDRLEAAKQWQKTSMDIKPAPATLSGQSKHLVDESTSEQFDAAPASLETEMALLKDRLEAAREWQATCMDITPPPNVPPSISDPVDNPKETPVDTAFEVSDARPSTGSMSVVAELVSKVPYFPTFDHFGSARDPHTTEIEQLKDRLEAAKEWQEAGMDITPVPLFCKR